MIVISLFFSSANAQDSFRVRSVAQFITTDSTTLSGMVITRFMKSDTISTFSLRRVRLKAKAQITPKADAAVLLNLTDSKILEMSTIKYRFNDQLNLQVGQFRPYFGREDLYPEELLQSLEWTNLYYAFGANGWQSFQVGATVFGSAHIFNMPMKYYAGVFNGNCRTQLMDNDNGKLFPVRLEVGIRPKTKLGLNGGIGKSKGEKIWAINVDMDHVAQLGGPWELELQSEYKRGTNNSLFDTSVIADKLMKNYLIAGYYVLPNLKYNMNLKHVQTLELSMRYEFINYDEKKVGCTKQTCIPMVSCQLAKEQFLRFELGMILDKYTRHTTKFICQLQARF